MPNNKVGRFLRHGVECLTNNVPVVYNVGAQLAD